MKTAAEVKAILGKDFPARRWKDPGPPTRIAGPGIERCPFVVISSTNAAGAMDVSPKGDPAICILDEQAARDTGSTGQRGDTLNVLENPGQVGLLFIVPKRREVARQRRGRGRGPWSRLAAWRSTANRRTLALLARVREAFFPLRKVHDPPGLWEPDRWGPSIDGLPTCLRTGPQGSRWLSAALPDIERGGGVQ